MAFIAYVPEAALSEAERVPDRDNIIQIHAVHPAVMRQHYDLYVELMHKRGPLSRIQREMIAVTVSAINRCHYWLQHHGAGLRRLLTAAKQPPHEQDQLIAALSSDYTSAALSAADRAMLDYAVTLTQAPHTISETDIEALRAAKFEDRAIHDICAITAYYAFVNRIADGLGVELEATNTEPSS